MRYLLILMMIIPFSGMTEDFVYDRFAYEYKEARGDGVKTYLGDNWSAGTWNRAGFLHFLLEFDDGHEFMGFKGREYYVYYNCIQLGRSKIINTAVWTGPKGTGDRIVMPNFFPEDGNFADGMHDAARFFVELWCYNEHSDKGNELQTQRQLKWKKKFDEMARERRRHCINEKRRCQDNGWTPGDDWPLNTDRASSPHANLDD
jgi:nuclear transport factor 2 (NTF2) superfamily protein